MKRQIGFPLELQFIDDATWRAAYGGFCEALFQRLFFNSDTYDLSSVGRMKFNKRLGRDNSDGPVTLTKEDILEAIKLLVELRNGAELLMI